MHAKGLLKDPIDDEEIPALLLQLAAQLLAKAQAKTPENGCKDGDRLLSVEEAAARLGVKKTYLWSHTDQLPFARRLGRKTRFSERGIEQFIKEKQGAR